MLLIILVQESLTILAPSLAFLALVRKVLRNVFNEVLRCYLLDLLVRLLVEADCRPIVEESSHLRVGHGLQGFYKAPSLCAFQCLYITNEINQLFHNSRSLTLLQSFI